MLTPNILPVARDELRRHERRAETQLLPDLVAAAASSPGERRAITARAEQLVHAVRHQAKTPWIAQLLSQYPISSEQGIALLTLAESFMRVPDPHTANLLLRDKLGGRSWRPLTNRPRPASIRAAMSLLGLTGALLTDTDNTPLRWLQGLAAPLIRLGTAVGIRSMAGQFVYGTTIESALHRARRDGGPCSFDMLGESARTNADAVNYFHAYRTAIIALGAELRSGRATQGQHTISVKLSALCPRYEPLQATRAVPELVALMQHLCELAMIHGIGLTIDAEESERLELMLDILEQLMVSPALANWDGLGLAAQAYQRRALPLLRWLDELAARCGRRLTVRLVKGAYWDSEIKNAQEAGLEDFPVFSRKAATDTSYLACARALLGATHLRPAFATHNAITVATLLEWIGDRRDVEFQRLHGMGAELHAAATAQSGVPCRVYAPVGRYRDLLAYLIRRMLENGANAGFVQKANDPGISDAALLEDPVATVRASGCTPHPAILPPRALYGATRTNSRGLDLASRDTLHSISMTYDAFLPINNGSNTMQIEVRNPAKPAQIVGKATGATQADVGRSIVAAVTAQRAWARQGVATRAACLDRAAELLEQRTESLMALLTAEAGKTRADALAEVREAVDFCRYYAAQARTLLVEQSLPGPAGESNSLTLQPRGLFACISPWNFPLAIFMGQVVAALVVGNAVIAKPAPQTPLTALAAVEILHAAGVPTDVLALLVGGGEVGEWIVSDARIAGVAFTGSTATARRIARSALADENRPLLTLIAETGGINAMIVDSTALTEQVVGDVIASAFQSAGQRCSALRLLCLQDEVYEATLAMLKGAMAELRVGDPAEEATDVGPLIDAAARTRIETYLGHHQARILYTTPRDAALTGWFVSPTLVELQRPEDLREEVFGPVLHVVRWQAGKLQQLIDTINASGYGLTLGLHSRLSSAAKVVQEGAHVGNTYINRTMIGAVVGSQPFGGEGLSGTGPKAGGPHYLLRFCTERTLSIDTTSAGGNASLLGLDG